MSMEHLTKVDVEEREGRLFTQSTPSFKILKKRALQVLHRAYNQCIPVKISAARRVVLGCRSATIKG